MAVIDQDNFSNISWTSEGPGPASSSSDAGASRDARGQEEMSNREVAEAVEANYMNQLDAGGLGSEVLECTVGSPLSENEGTNSQFVSYLVTTHVSLYSRLLRLNKPLPSAAAGSVRQLADVHI